MAEPIRQLPLLIDLLVEDLGDWPDDAWLVLDDYHEIMASAEAEDLIAEMIATTRVRVLIASRRRPSWTTARGLFYGDWYELTQSDLAMTSAETYEVLANSGGQRSPELVAIANGWPAFIGLAASSVRVRPRSGQAQSDLYSFLLDEIYATTDAETQHALRELSLAPRDHGRLLRALQSAETSVRIEAEAMRVGMLTAGPEGDLELHPLLGSSCSSSASTPAQRSSTLQWNGSGNSFVLTNDGTTCSISRSQPTGRSASQPCCASRRTSF